MRITEALDLVTTELARAVRKHRPMASAHEGWAVIREELDELWDEIRKQEAVRDQATLRKEAAQVGAMALRFLIDVCGGDHHAPS